MALNVDITVHYFPVSDLQRRSTRVRRPFKPFNQGVVLRFIWFRANLDETFTFWSKGKLVPHERSEVDPDFPFIKPEIRAKAEANRNIVYKIGGARNDLQADTSTVSSAVAGKLSQSSSHSQNFPRVMTAGMEVTYLQKSGSYCAVLAVHNGVSFGLKLQPIKSLCGPQANLHQVRKHLNCIQRPPCQLKSIAAESQLAQLALLRRQTTGAFAMEFVLDSGLLHVVTWLAAAAGASMILETDPSYPQPLATTAEQLEELGILDATVNEVFEIVACSSKKRKH